MCSIINVSNIRTWSCDIVVNWMKALDPCLERYGDLFHKKKIDGSRLADLNHDDLIKLGMDKVGPQCILIDAIDAVSKLSPSYMESETLQLYVSKLAVASTCLTEAIQSYVTLLNVIDSDPQNRFLYELDKGRYQLDVYSCVVGLVDAARDTLAWLSRSPFHNTAQVDTEPMQTKDAIFSAVRDIIKKFCSYSESNLPDKSNPETKDLKYQQQDKFSKNPDKLLQDIKETSLKLSTTCEKYVTNFKDSLAVIPCQVFLVNLKKLQNDSKWGITLLTLNNPLPTHIISDINEDSSATGASKIHRGDEVLAVGDIPVVCLPHAMVSNLIEQSPCELQLILKKRPAHRPTCENQRRPPWKRLRGTSKNLRKSQNRSSLKKKGASLSNIPTAAPSPFPKSVSVPSTPNPNRDDDDPPPLIEDVEFEPSTPVHQSTTPTITLTEPANIWATDTSAASRAAKPPIASSPIHKPREKFPSTSDIQSDVRSKSAGFESPKKRLRSHGGREDSKRESCRLAGNGECFGWLMMKKKTSHMLPANWYKRYCVLKHYTLYFYKSELDEKAEGLINMRSSDIKVSPGESNKPDRFPFHIRSHLVSFTFATDTESNRKKWMNKLGLVAIGYQNFSNDDSLIAGFRKPYTSTTSETGSSSEGASESSGDEDVLSPLPSTPDTPVVSRRVLNPRPLTRILEGADESTDMDEHQKRESDLLRKILSCMRLEREIREREEFLGKINNFLSGPINSNTLSSFMNEHRSKLLVNHSTSSSA